MQRSLKTSGHPVTAQIRETLNSIWAKATTHEGRRGRGRPAKHADQPTAPVDKMRELGNSIVERRRNAQRRGRRSRQIQARSAIKEIGEEFTEQWKERWEVEKRKPYRSAPTWNDPWESQPLHLYDNVPKHVATAILLLRTEVLGTRAWLAKAAVPGILPTCTCGHSRQTLTHLRAYCRDASEARLKLLERAGTIRTDRLLTHKDTAWMAGRWLLDTNVLDYFRTAKEDEKVEMESWTPFQKAHEVPT